MFTRLFRQVAVNAPKIQIAKLHSSTTLHASPALSVPLTSGPTLFSDMKSPFSSQQPQQSILLPSRQFAVSADKVGAMANPREAKKLSVKFVLDDHSGSLQEALKFFWKHDISLTRIESRPAKRSRDYEFYVDFKGTINDVKVQDLIKELKQNCRDVSILQSKKVPWFPRKIKEVDRLAQDILDAGGSLQADHPGFSDPVYRKRRKELADLALNYKVGTPIPKIAYSPDEIKTWGVVWDKLTPLYEKHACNEHVRLLPLLTENCGYRADNIPQMGDVSDFLKECTGFTVRPVAGLLSARNFLYGLAFRIFFSTQYIRHSSKPLYTPEPDVCHELLGHAPLFADLDFADFSQEIGLASIGATDEQITQLARCYWFSVEFGLCLQDGKRKAFGAGLLSSFGELEYSMSDEPEIRKWDPFHAGKQEYPITTYQPIYYIADSFADAKIKMQEFSNSFARPFNVRYDPYSQTIDVDSNIEVAP